jgi:hypothetical protein
VCDSREVTLCAIESQAELVERELFKDPTASLIMGVDGTRR